METLPVTAIVPTRNRAIPLRQTLLSLVEQQEVPAQLIVIDASDNGESRSVLDAFRETIGSHCAIDWQPAEVRGAAAQRNQAMARVHQPVVWFFDDDIAFEPGCVARLWAALQRESRLGGVNAMIVNQRYQAPGRVSRTLFRLLHGRSEATYAGLVIGPAVNLLPEDADDLPDVVAVDWLNTTCTMYRREALPDRPFDAMFSGYSMLEDLALSLRVGRQWKLANARTARIVHDSQPSAEKSDLAAMASMELINRHYVMTQVLGRRALKDYARLLLWEAFQVGASTASARNGRALWAQCRGKIDACRRVRHSFNGVH
jgi:glycosyltransferase involved in cell wall biosynthesis